ncbi:MAG: hypothetical protein M0035_07860 [Actinomycetota bacterium]|jgi:hypothetical protein|nr:hypothetical protein [Actinomycetota bacterium]
MPAPASTDAVPPFRPAAGSSWASAASSALCDVEPWSATGGMLAGGPPLRANAVLRLRPGLSRGPKGLICDLSGVSFLGAAGLTVLLVARLRAMACHA